MAYIDKILKQLIESKEKLYEEMEKDEYINYQMFNSALRVINAQDKYIKCLEESVNK